MVPTLIADPGRPDFSPDFYRPRDQSGLQRISVLEGIKTFPQSFSKFAALYDAGQLLNAESVGVMSPVMKFFICCQKITC
jgi:hypothetical protein